MLGIEFRVAHSPELAADDKIPTVRGHGMP